MEATLKDLVHRGLQLPLMEAFYTIQGEGYHKGTAAYFVRIGGCDVGCHWCDVKEAGIQFTRQQRLTKSYRALKHSKTVVVTGGEPLMWNMTPLTDALGAAGMQIHIETSGAYPVSGRWD